MLMLVDPSGTANLDLVSAVRGAAGRVRRTAVDLPWGCMPPPGTSSRQDWSGVDSKGNPVHFGVFNCTDSVNYFLCGDPHCAVYHAWQKETLENPDDSVVWDHLEASLQVGDVVEFVAHIQYPSGFRAESLFHVHICAGQHGLMAGANNDPHFEEVDGVPMYTGEWAFCTSRAYYKAMRAADSQWQAAGFSQTYNVLVYRNPVSANP